MRRLITPCAANVTVPDSEAAEDGEKRRGFLSADRKTITRDRAPAPARRGGGKASLGRVSSWRCSYASATAGSSKPPFRRRLLSSACDRRAIRSAHARL